MTTDADLLMKQAGYTAEYWLRTAKAFVEEAFKDLPPAQRTTLIAAYVQAAALDEGPAIVALLLAAGAAYVQAAALDEGAMAIRDVAKSVEEVALAAAQSLEETTL